MKKVALLILFWIAFLPLIAQVNFVTVEGYVTDIYSGAPIVNHAVTIQTLPTSGFFIHDVVYTSETGFYIDTLTYNTGEASDRITIFTFDCNQHRLSDTLPIGISNEIIVNFLICVECHAMYSSVPDTGNPMNLHFYDQSNGNNIASWFWNFGDGTTSDLRNPVHLYVQPRKYQVCLTVRSSDSTCSSEYCDSIRINGNGGCQAQFTWYADSVTGTNSVQFRDLSIGASNWLWNFGDSLSGVNNISLLQNPIHIFTGSGPYHVCLTIGNQAGTCNGTWCLDITPGGNVGCTSYFTFSQNALNVAFQGYLVKNLPATYTWSFGDGTGGTGQNVTHTYATPGGYYISLTTLTDSTNCSFSSGFTIFVGDSSHFNQIYGQVIENNFPLSSGIAMIFSIDSTNNNNPFTATSQIDSSGMYNFNYVPQGNFVVWVIPFDSTGYLPTYYGNVTDWQQATVISLGNPANPYNITMVKASSAMSGNGGINVHMNTSKMTSSLTNMIRMILLNESGNALEFRNNGGSNEFDFSTLSYGVYFLRAELPGCTSNLVRVEITQDKPIANVVMTYSGTKLLGISDGNTLIEGITTYPNPVIDQLNLSIASKKDAPILVTISDLSGRNVSSEVYNLTIGNNGIQINTSMLQAGMFILRITSNDGTNLVRKVIKTQ